MPTIPPLSPTITRVSYRYFLPAQNVAELGNAADGSIPPSGNATLWAMRRGETAILQRVTETRFYHVSRFEPYYGYYGHDDTPAQIETLATYRWTGKEWKTI